MLSFELVVSDWSLDSDPDVVDITVEPGEFVFLTGPTGAGKTYVFELLF